MTKAQELSRRLLDRSHELAGRDGVSFREGLAEAWNEILGDVVPYDAFVSDLYDTLRARAAA